MLRGSLYIVPFKFKLAFIVKRGTQDLTAHLGLSEIELGIGITNKFLSCIDFD